MRVHMLSCFVIVSPFIGAAFTYKTKLGHRVATKLHVVENNRLAGVTVLAFLVGTAAVASQPVVAADTSNKYDLSLRQRSFESAQMERFVHNSAPLILSSFGAPSFSGGSSFETLDFSLPSYNEAVRGGTDSKTDSPSGPPAFTTTFKEPEVSLSPPSSPPAPAAVVTTPPVVTQKSTADENAKAAAAAAAAAEKKKAELQARRALEKQKQLEMVQRSSSKVEKTASSKDEDTTNLKPASPAIDKAQVVPATVSTPPTLEFKAPEIPSIQLPSVSMPTFEAPKIEVPDLKALKFNLPTLDVPQKMESESTSSKPQFIPRFEASTSSIPPNSKEEEEVMESQELRDERAREAKALYNEKDAAAKEVERQAAEARKTADEAKQVFRQAKDDACKTRWGGKLLCLRWGVGY